MIVYVSNTNLLQLNDLKKELDGSAVTGAAVTVTIASKAGVQLAGMAWPAGMTEVGGGDYQLQLPSTLSWVADGEYVATVDAASSAGVGHWEHHFKARVRTTS